MIDVSQTIAPKSDQLNADDLLGGKTITIKITKVSGDKTEQPILIHFEGDNGKPYKPCKSMRRVLVYAWGKYADQYVGRSLTLYCDPTVKFGGAEVGGIRISHMSHIDKAFTMALTASKAVRKPYSVKPLVADNGSAAPVTDATALIDEGNEAAERGTEILKTFWSRLKKPQQEPLLGYIDGWKKRAADVDQMNENPASNILNAG
jgi:hypothetical protein